MDMDIEPAHEVGKLFYWLQHNDNVTIKTKYGQRNVTVQQCAL